MLIRNDREVTLLVPSQHMQANPGEEITWPADAPVPSGFTIVTQPAPTKADLLHQAALLGITVPHGATKAAVADLITNHVPSVPETDADEADAHTTQEHD